MTIWFILNERKTLCLGPRNALRQSIVANSKFDFPDGLGSCLGPVNVIQHLTECKVAWPTLSGCGAIVTNKSKVSCERVAAHVGEFGLECLVRSRAAVLVGPFVEWTRPISGITTTEPPLIFALHVGIGWRPVSQTDCGVFDRACSGELGNVSVSVFAIGVVRAARRAEREDGEYE